MHVSIHCLSGHITVQVCELMFVEGRTVSHAAGEFATRYLFSEDFMTKAKQAKVPKGELCVRVCVCVCVCVCVTEQCHTCRPQETH